MQKTNCDNTNECEWNDGNNTNTTQPGDNSTQPGDNTTQPVDNNTTPVVTPPSTDLSACTHTAWYNANQTVVDRCAAMDMNECMRYSAKLLSENRTECWYNQCGQDSDCTSSTNAAMFCQKPENFTTGVCAYNSSVAPSRNESECTHKDEFGRYQYTVRLCQTLDQD